MHPNAGKLEVILGCMFSGKSSEMIARIRQYQVIGKKMLIINHSSDTRYTTAPTITTHDRITIEALPATNAMHVLSMPMYPTVEVIFIEEGQFFEDLVEFIRIAVDKDRKHVVVSGLDGDYNREPFYTMMNLIPLADHVVRRNALCIQCRDGTLASFSKRTIHATSRHLVGSEDVYIPVCRYHYHVPADT
jgi:thymidine kinase